MQETARFPVDVAPAQFDVKVIRWAQTSPDGSKVVFEALGNLWIRDLRNGVAGAPRRLTRQSDHFELYPSWSRDGRSIVYTTWNDQDLGTLRVIPAGGGEGRVISAHPGHYLEPQFSPDGQFIYFTSDRGGSPQIYRVPAGGGNPERVTFEGSYNVSPRPSPDGKSLAFISRRDGRFQLAVMDLASKQVQILSDSHKDESPSFAPNSRMIVLATEVGGRGVLSAVSADGRIKQRLSVAAGDVREPAWGPFTK